MKVKSAQENFRGPKKDKNKEISTESKISSGNLRGLKKNENTKFSSKVKSAGEKVPKNDENAEFSAPEKIPEKDENAEFPWKIKSAGEI